MNERSGDFESHVASLLGAVSKAGPTSFREMAEVAGLDPAADFIGADLSGLDFRDEDLSGFNFSRADLRFVDFRRANVNGVVLSGAQLTGAIGLPEFSAERVDPSSVSLREVKRLIASGVLPPKEFVDEVEELRFGDTAIRNIEVLQVFPRLKRLSLINRRINSFQPIEGIQTLRHLELNGANIKSIGEIGMPKKLQEIDASFSALENLEGIEKLKELRTLDIGSTKVSSLESLKFNKLQTLDASNTNVNDIESLRSMHELSNVDLNRTKISNINYLSELKSIVNLDISKTDVSSIDSLVSNSHLELLNIADTNVKDISCIRNFTRLKMLRAGGNPGLSPTDVIGSLSNLRYLDLGGCEIEDIQFDITSLEHIYSLSLSDNKLKKIAVQNDSKSIRGIHLNSNPLRDLSFLLKFPNLRHISIMGIPDIDFSPLYHLKFLGTVRAEVLPVEMIEFFINSTHVHSVVIDDDYYSTVFDELTKKPRNDKIIQYMREKRYRVLYI